MSIFSTPCHIFKMLNLETQIIRYALSFLLSNLDEDVIEDISTFVGTTDDAAIEEILRRMIDKQDEP